MARIGRCHGVPSREAADAIAAAQQVRSATGGTSIFGPMGLHEQSRLRERAIGWRASSSEDDEARERFTRLDIGGAVATTPPCRVAPGSTCRAYGCCHQCERGRVASPRAGGCGEQDRIEMANPTKVGGARPSAYGPDGGLGRRGCPPAPCRPNRRRRSVLALLRPRNWTSNCLGAYS